MSPTVVEILESCPFFADINESAFRRLFAIARLVRFRAGQLIFLQGAPCPGMYIVGRGLVRIFKRGKQGRERVLHLVGPGETFAEVAAIGNFPCPASAEAVAPTTCALVPLEPLQKLIHEDHELCRQLLLGLCLWVRRLVDLVEDLTLRDATARVARLLLQKAPEDHPLLRLPTLKRHLAAQLDLTSETFSRVLRRLELNGAIKHLGRNELEIVNRGKLLELAQLEPHEGT